MPTLDEVLSTINSDPPNSLEAAVSFFEHGPTAFVLTQGGTVIEAMLRQAHTIGLSDSDLAFALASTAGCLTEYEKFEATPQEEKDRLAGAAFAALGAICADGFNKSSKVQKEHISEAFTLSQKYFGGRHYNDSFVQGGTTGLRHAVAPRPGEFVSPAQRFLRRSGCATGIAALLLMFYAMGLIKLPFKLPWEYDYVGRYGYPGKSYEPRTNPTYDNLGKDAKGYTEIVRAFKAKHPDLFEKIIEDARAFKKIHPALNKGTGFPLPEAGSILWGVNTDEAQRLIRANLNILYQPYKAFSSSGNRYVAPESSNSGWLTDIQAGEILLEQADQPKLSGVGIHLSLDKQTKEVVVVALYDGSPAFRAGVQPKDVIVTIDGMSTKGMSTEEAVKLIRGNAGTTVKLTLRRNSALVDVPLIREMVDVNKHKLISSAYAKPVTQPRLPFKLPWEYDYAGRYEKNPAYDELGKDVKGYTEIVRAFYAKHRLLAFKMFDRYGVFKGLPKESLYLNINTDEAQRFLRANANIKLHNSKKTGSSNPNNGWISEQLAGEIISAQVEGRPRDMPPGLRRHIDEMQREMYRQTHIRR